MKCHFRANVKCHLRANVKCHVQANLKFHFRASGQLEESSRVFGSKRVLWPSCGDVLWDLPMTATDGNNMDLCHETWVRRGRAMSTYDHLKTLYPHVRDNHCFLQEDTYVLCAWPDVQLQRLQCMESVLSRVRW